MTKHINNLLEVALNVIIVLLLWFLCMVLAQQAATAYPQTNCANYSSNVIYWDGTGTNAVLMTWYQAQVQARKNMLNLMATNSVKTGGTNLIKK